MKITWLRRITLTDSPWQSVIKDTINFYEVFSFGPNYVDSLLPKIKNTFWTDVLRAYSELLNKNEIVNEDSILSSPVFHNKEIRVGNIPVCIKNWFKKGVYYINDLISENGQLVSQEEFERMYDIKTNFIQFQGIIHAIKNFARKHSVMNFTKKTKNAIYSCKYLFPNQIKKGGGRGKDFL